MKTYIGTKVTQAKVMTLGAYNNMRGWSIPEDEDQERKGYQVVYSDGYISWSPKETFEAAYSELSGVNTITPTDVEAYIKDVEASQLGDKTTVVKAVLANGFIIVESSSCVDPKNFDMKMGEDICMQKIKNKVWELLGFNLQCGLKEV